MNINCWRWLVKIWWKDYIFWHFVKRKMARKSFKLVANNMENTMCRPILTKSIGGSRNFHLLYKGLQDLLRIAPTMYGIDE